MANYTIYTDGAATMKKIKGEYVREAGGCAFVVYDAGNIRLYEWSGHSDQTTNNEMELSAIFHAIKWLQEREDFDPFSAAVLLSDSAYCVNIFNDWAAKWEANAWTRGRKHEPIENLELVKAIYYELKKMPNVKIQKVVGHGGVAGNTRADKLAVDAKHGTLVGRDPFQEL